MPAHPRAVVPVLGLRRSPYAPVRSAGLQLGNPQPGLHGTTGLQRGFWAEMLRLVPPARPRKRRKHQSMCIGIPRMPLSRQ